MSDYIYHHGIKGQKWGVRRYQNPDGTLTSMGKARKRAIDVNRNMDAVNDIVKTMSRKDKELLNLDGDVYQQSAEDGYAYVKRFIEKSGDVPISFLTSLAMKGSSNFYWNKSWKRVSEQGLLLKSSQKRHEMAGRTQRRI